MHLQIYLSQYLNLESRKVNCHNKTLEKETIKINDIIMPNYYPTIIAKIK